MFLIGCYTGLRYSDYSTISSANIQKIEGVEAIVKVSKKTDTRIIIPIHPVVSKILKKYNGVLPTAPSNQKTNDGIKFICDYAGICDPIIRTEYKGGDPRGRILRCQNGSLFLRILHGVLLQRICIWQAMCLRSQLWQ